MPNACCAVGCTNRKSKEQQLIFYRIPAKNLSRRNSWLAAIKRTKWSEESIKHARLCSAHFISGKKSDDPENPDFVPSVFPHIKVTERVKQQKGERHKRLTERRKSKEKEDPVQSTPTYDDEPLLESSNVEKETDEEKIERFEKENEFLKNKMKLLEESIKQKDEIVLRYQNDSIKRLNENVNLKETLSLLKKTKFCYKYVKKDEKMHYYYTGLSKDKFKWLLDGLEDAKIVTTKLAKSDHLFLVLLKLKMGLSNKDLGYRFGVCCSAVSRLYRTWLPILAKELIKYINWPEKIALRKYLPKCFRRKYSKCACIIDCTEIFIERPLSLTSRAQTWSNYKNHNTIKYLIACSPSGAVSFLSEGWGGRVSDKEITTKSGFLDLIEHGDQVLADRGFTIAEELATRGGILEIPCFTKGKSQLTAKEVHLSRQVANVRIHIERVIGRLRKYQILNTIIPTTQADLLDDVMICVSGLVNINRSVIV